MKERLLEFLKTENKSSAQLAEEIGVQPSGISHILSGRNNPSLDFVMKMLDKYHFLSTDWLLFGKGTMYKDNQMQTLFGEESDIEREINLARDRNEPLISTSESQNNTKDEKSGDSYLPRNIVGPKVVKIVWFFDNKHFEEYVPGH